MQRIVVRAWFVGFFSLLAAVFAGCLPDPPHLSDVDGGPDDASGEPDVTMVGMTTPEAGGDDAPLDAPGTGTPEAGADGGDAGEGGTGSCGPANCAAGCCDDSGVCQMGADPGACGMGGARCAVCAVGTSCSNHACSCGGSGSGCLGCCTGSGSCVTAAHDTCGANGGACSACGDGQECVNGSCVCDATSCPTGCCDGNTCVTTGQDVTQCGTGGAGCSACGANQACVSGACACTPTSCPNGCCSGATCLDTTAQSPTACGSAGNACGTCATGQGCSGGACSCGGTSCGGCCANGACSTTPSSTACGLGGGVCSTCAAKQECSAQGKCVCDASSCPNGCCDASGTCQTSSTSTCGVGGAACVSCGSGQTCSAGGSCTCNGSSCPSGCCNGVTCVPYASEGTGTCGVSGATCGACATGQRCNGSGACVCDATSCPSGCCDSGGHCQTSSNPTCGVGGKACTACGSGQTCSAGTCTCTASSCSGGCCSGASCVPHASETAGTCGASGATCKACSLSEANAACSTANGTCSVASCVSGFADCDGTASNGCEINLKSNAGNCGACGHSCKSGGCATSCQPWLVAKATASVAGLATDGTNVVWIDNSSLKVLQTGAAGGSAISQLALVGSGRTLEFIRMANATIAFTALNSSSSQLELYFANESSPTTATFSPLTTWGDGVGPAVERGLGINTTGGTAYFEYFDDLTGAGGIEACNLSVINPSCTNLEGNESGEFPDDLTFANGHVFWTEDDNSTVENYTLSGSSLATEASGQNGPYALTTDATYVYWANQAVAASTFSIFRGTQVSPNPGSPQQVLSPTAISTTQSNPNFIATDGKYVYFSGAASEIEYVPVGGGTAATLLAGASGALAEYLAVAGGALYYFDTGDSSIHGIATPP